MRKKKAERAKKMSNIRVKYTLNGEKKGKNWVDGVNVLLLTH